MQRSSDTYLTTVEGSTEARPKLDVSAFANTLPVGVDRIALDDCFGLAPLECNAQGRPPVGQCSYTQSSRLLRDGPHERC